MTAAVRLYSLLFGIVAADTATTDTLAARETFYRAALAWGNGRSFYPCLVLIGNEADITKDFMEQAGFIKDAVITARGPGQAADITLDRECSAVVLEGARLDLPISDLKTKYNNHLHWFFPLGVVRNNVEALNLRLDSLVYEYVLDDYSFSIWEFYRIKGGSLRTNLLTSWNTTDEDDWYHSGDDIWERRRDLGGLVLSTAVLPSYPNGILEIDDEGNIVSVAGIFPEIYNVLAAACNFSYTVSRPADGEFGTRDSDNGTWSGIIGMVISGEVDMSLSGFTLTTQRMEAVDFATPLYQDSLTLFVRKPNEDLKWSAYLDEYSDHFWAVLTMTVLTLALAFVAFENSGVGCLHAKLEPFRMTNALGLVGVTILQREYKVEAIDLSSRMMLFTTLVMGFLCYASYTAEMTSILTMELISSPIGGLDDVYDLGYQMLVWEGTAYEDFFKLATEGPAKDLWDDRIKNDPESFITSKEEGLMQVAAASSGVVTLLPSLSANGLLDSVMRNLSCDILRVPLVGGGSRLLDGTILTKGSEFTEFFSHYIYVAVETGVADRVMVKYLPKDQEPCENSATEIGYSTVVSAFTLLGAGLVAGVLFGVVERLRARTTIVSHYDGGTPSSKKKIDK